VAKKVAVPQGGPLDVQAETAMAVLGNHPMYVVVEKGWEYDDQYFNPTGEGGSPVKAFFSKKAAEDYRLDLEAKRIVGLDLGYYFGEDGPEARVGLSGAELLEKLGQILGAEEVAGEDPTDLWDFTLPTMTREKARQVAKLLDGIAGYEVVKVPVG
jgi:hypothetical protein